MLSANPASSQSLPGAATNVVETCLAKTLPVRQITFGSKSVMRRTTKTSASLNRLARVISSSSPLSSSAPANLRSASYSVNSKNQYTSRGVPPYIEVLGIAKVDATVTVDGSSSGVYRRGEYFRKELSVNNASAAQYPTIEVDTDVTDPVSGKKYLPLDPESFTYDDDGSPREMDCVHRCVLDEKLNAGHRPTA